MTSGNGRPGSTYEYRESGSKSKTRNLPKYDYKPNTAIGAIQWEDSELQFTPPSGGTVTTIYDEKDRPKEGEIRDATGQLILRIVRTYDEHGRIKGDKVVFEQVQTPLLPEIEQAPEFNQLNAAQKRTLMNLVTRAFSGGESAFTYDAQGRVVEKHVNRGGLGNDITKISYNEHGDLIEETTARTFSPEFAGEFGMDDAGNVIPGKKSQAREPSQTMLRYTYEYDTRGNWTKKTTESRSESDGQFGVSMIVQRTLTYY